MTQDPPGLTLEEALKKYSDPNLWEEYQKGLNERGGIPQIIASLGDAVAGVTEETYPILKVARELLEPFLQKLESGELVATGYDSRLPATKGRIKISADLWKYLAPNTKDSSAHADSYSFQGVRVQAAQALSIRALNDCRTWLSERFRAGEQPASQGELFREAHERFPGLSGRAFKGLWKEMAPRGWKEPGRRKQPLQPVSGSVAPPSQEKVEPLK